MVEVSPEEFKRANRGLVKLISTINRAGKDGISTRRLLQEIGANEESHIYRAEREGYIIRKEREPESGRGFKPVYNIITPKGRDLLEELGVITRNSESRSRSSRHSFARKTPSKNKQI